MGKKISPAQAKELFDNWTAPKGPGQAIRGTKFKDTFETWFTVQELKDYLEYVEKNIPASENPGVRVYFGNYGNSEPGDKKDSCTVFFAPTRGGDELNLLSTENDYDLEAYNSGGGSIPPKKYDPNQ